MWKRKHVLKIGTEELVKIANLKFRVKFRQIVIEIDWKTIEFAKEDSYNSSSESLTNFNKRNLTIFCQKKIRAVQKNAGRIQIL